jgi:hypothetical protein
MPGRLQIVVINRRRNIAVKARFSPVFLGSQTGGGEHPFEQALTAV